MAKIAVVGQENEIGTALCNLSLFHQMEVEHVKLGDLTNEYGLVIIISCDQAVEYLLKVLGSTAAAGLPVMLVGLRVGELFNSVNSLDQRNRVVAFAETTLGCDKLAEVIRIALLGNQNGEALLWSNSFDGPGQRIYT